MSHGCFKEQFTADVYAICISPNKSYCAVLANEQKVSVFQLNGGSSQNITSETPSGKKAFEPFFPENTKSYCYSFVLSNNKGEQYSKAVFFDMKVPLTVTRNEVKEFGMNSLSEYVKDLKNFTVIDDELRVAQPCAECETKIRKKNLSKDIITKTNYQFLLFCNQDCFLRVPLSLLISSTSLMNWALFIFTALQKSMVSKGSTSFITIITS